MKSPETKESVYGGNVQAPRSNRDVDTAFSSKTMGRQGIRTRVRNDLFNPKEGLDRGRPLLVETAWYLMKCAFFLSPLPYPSSFKTRVLRLFGARVGKGVVIKPRVNIHFPWKLSIGDHAWIGEEVFILNLEPVTIGAHCCISQRAFLCAGNHDYTIVHSPYRNEPIDIQAGAWVGAQSFIAAGVTVGAEAMIACGSVVTDNQPPAKVCRGNPCRPVRDRWPSRAQTNGEAEPYSKTEVFLDK